MSTSPSRPFYTRYGFSRTGESAAPLSIAPYPELCTGGALRATIVASAVDLVGSLFTREVAGTDATFTSDLSVRIVRPHIPERLLAHGERLRAGRRLVTTGVRLEAAGEAYAYGETTFSRIARESDTPPDLATLSLPNTIERHPLSRPLDEEVGIEVVDAATGSVRLPLRPALLNPEGVMQGALVALVAECSALTLAGHARRSQQVITELDVRYLSAVSVGPVEGRAAWIGGSEAGMLRVVLRDLGRGDRLTTTALIRVVPAILDARS
ncbi:MAG: hypothetical protein CL908_10845 [Deltaproteobacteria bacterium]|jgi:acyl-coenzyme A thioesterase PaaI-like protein|nr:hypothetical protein [Deltaproteobacteria bacterium]